MNNEPVAWIAYDEFGDFMLEATPEGDYPWKPLYTHPSEHDLGVAEAIGFDKGYKAATAKTLTDEEIDSIWAEMSEQCDEEFIDMKQFAKAILKKASEK